MNFFLTLLIFTTTLTLIHGLSFCIPFKSTTFFITFSCCPLLSTTTVASRPTKLDFFFISIVFLNYLPSNLMRKNLMKKLTFCLYSCIDFFFLSLTLHPLLYSSISRVPALTNLKCIFDPFCFSLRTICPLVQSPTFRYWVQSLFLAFLFPRLVQAQLLIMRI